MGTLNCYLVFQSFCFVALYYVMSSVTGTCRSNQQLKITISFDGICVLNKVNQTATITLQTLVII